MNARRLLILALALSLTGCLSQSTKEELKDLGTEVGHRVGQSMKEEGKKIVEESKQAAFEGAKAAVQTTIAKDPDIPQPEKDDLAKKLADATGFLGIGGVLLAYAKAKASSRARKALGIVVNAAQSLPENALDDLKSLVKSKGGNHPAVKSLIEEVKI